MTVLSIKTPNDSLAGFRTVVYPDKTVTYWGGGFNEGIAPRNLTGYQATVYADGVQTTALDIPFHDWHTRFVYDPTPDDIKLTNLDIFAKGLMFPYGNPGKNTPSKPTNKWTGWMSSAGVYTAMGATGERGDIGLLPEWEAYALRTGDFGPAIEAAKAFDSMPVWRLDKATRRLIDMTVYPQATEDYRSANRPDYIPVTDPNTAQPKGQWAMDISHHPATFVAFCATLKMQYLAATQAIANWCLQVNPWYTATAPSDGTMPIIHQLQCRGSAWTYRSLLLAYRATLLAEEILNGAPLEEPLLPSSYWKKILDANVNYFIEGYVKDPAIQVFRYHPDKNTYRGSWQFDYHIGAQGLGAFYFKKDPKFVGHYLWSMGNPIWRLNGKSGWPPAHQSPYDLRCGPTGIMPDSGNNFPMDIPPSYFYATPGLAWQQYAAEIKKAGGGLNMTVPQIDALLADPTGGGNFINWDSYTPQQLRHIMAQADFLDQNGIPVTATWPDFPACRDRIESMVLRWEAQSPGNIIASRVSIVSGTVSLPPPTNTPPPPPTTPPPGVPPMTDALATLNSAIATLKADVAAEIKAAHDRFAAIIAAATGSGTTVDPAELQAAVDQLNSLHTTLTTDTAAIPTATA
jgi:hypothetical protein